MWLGNEWIDAPSSGLAMAIRPGDDERLLRPGLPRLH